MKSIIGPVTGFMVLLASIIAAAGNLQIGEPTVESEQVTFPVMLGGDVGQGVAAIDFRLRYDPAMLEPVEVGAGSAASSADKLVQSNVPKPGECVVVVMGMNQTTVTGGEVARVTMRRTGKAHGASTVSVARTTLASSDGQVIPSEGGERVLALGEAKDEVKPDTATTSAESTVADPEKSSGQTPDTAAQSVGQSGATSQSLPVGVVPRLVTPDAGISNPLQKAEPLVESRRTRPGPNDPETRQKITAALADAAKKRIDRIRTASSQESPGLPVVEQEGALTDKATPDVQAGSRGDQAGAVRNNSNTSGLQVESGDSGNRADDHVKPVAPGGVTEQNTSTLWIAGAVLLAVLSGIAIVIIKRRSNP